MKQFSKLMLVALSFGSLAVAMSLMPSKSVGAPPPGSAPVMVTNTPLPVQGTVGAMQNGSWNVGISGTPSVNISNSASSPVLQRNVDAGTLTHVGQKVSNLVGLFTTSTIFGLSGYQRNLPDGSATVISQFPPDRPSLSQTWTGRAGEPLRVPKYSLISSSLTAPFFFKLKPRPTVMARPMQANI